MAEQDQDQYEAIGPAGNAEAPPPAPTNIGVATPMEEEKKPLIGGALRENDDVDLDSDDEKKSSQLPGALREDDDVDLDSEDGTNPSKTKTKTKEEKLKKKSKLAQKKGNAAKQRVEKQKESPITKSNNESAQSGKEKEKKPANSNKNKKLCSVLFFVFVVLFLVGFSLFLIAALHAFGAVEFIDSLKIKKD